jgi:hypothetical protein
MRQSRVGGFDAANLDYLFATENLRDHFSDIAVGGFPISIPPFTHPKSSEAGAGIFAFALIGRHALELGMSSALRL